ncbi:MAG: WG repeat-containing protein [Bacteroidales bacterium]|nr:WG repeat-containing protein [Bacteroidales bacterium]
MKKFLACLLSGVFVLSAFAQKVPTMRPISEKKIHVRIAPLEKRGKWGYADEKEHFLIRPVFDHAEPFQTVRLVGEDTLQLARVTFENRYGYLRRDGTYLIEPVYEHISEFTCESAVFRNNGAYGFFSCDGTVKADGLQLMDPFNAQTGLAWFKKDNHWGVFDPQANVVFPNIYTRPATEKIAGNILLSDADGKKGLLTLTGRKTLLEPVYDSIALDAADPGLIVFTKDGKYGCALPDGRIIAGPEFEELRGSATRDRVFIRKDGRYGILSRANGRYLVPPVLRTNQFTGSEAFYACFSEAGTGYPAPAVYYKDRLYTCTDFDDILFSSLSHQDYAAPEEPSVFPKWMKKHLAECEEDGDYAVSWKYDYPVYPAVEETDIPSLEPLVLVDDADEISCRVRVAKDVSLLSVEGEGLEAAPGAKLTGLKYVSGGIDYPIGNWLSSLFRSVDSGKILQFDKEHDTDLMHEWSSISFLIPVLDVQKGGNMLVVADMYIDDRFMQRTVALLGRKAERLSQFKEDGFLYNPEHPADPDGLLLFRLGDVYGLVTSTIGEDVDPVRLYLLSCETGKELARADDFIPFEGFSLDGGLYFAGISPFDESPKAFRFQDGVLSRVNPIYDLANESIVFSGNKIFTFDRSTGLLKTYGLTGSRKHPTPVLRYTRSEWDGEPVVALSTNYWDDPDRAVWTFIPKVTEAMNGFHAHVGDALVQVRPANPEGISVYSVKHGDDMDDHLRYGYIGFDRDFFTFPMFDEASQMVDDTVTVKVAGETLRLGIADLEPFCNHPRDLYRAGDHPVGKRIFDDDQIRMALDGTLTPEAAVTGDGYRIHPSQGGALIPYTFVPSGTCGFVDKEGKIVTPPVYDGFYPADYSVDNLAAVLIADARTPEEYGIRFGWGFIDMTGKQVVPCEYNLIRTDQAQLFGNNGVAILAKKAEDGSTKWGCISKKGRIVVPFEHERIEYENRKLKLYDGNVITVVNMKD